MGLFETTQIINFGKCTACKIVLAKVGFTAVNSAFAIPLSFYANAGLTFSNAPPSQICNPSPVRKRDPTK